MKGSEDSINEEGINYTKRVVILDRTEINGTSVCFVTLKDRPHIKLCQPPTTTLITPGKSEIGRISISISDKINIYSCDKIRLSESKNTTDVIN